MNEKNQPRDEWLRTIEAHGASEVALEFGDRRVDYAQLCVMARTAQEDLASLGLHEGDLCAVLAPPSVEGVALFHGMLSAGIVLLPLSAPERTRTFAGPHGEWCESTRCGGSCRGGFRRAR